MKTAKLPTSTNFAIPAITEKQFASQVTQLAKILGWKVYHTWLSIRSEPGFPDLVLCRGKRIIFAELKTEKGTLTTGQLEWFHALNFCCSEVYLWRPSGFDGIRDILSR